MMHAGPNSNERVRVVTLPGSVERVLVSSCVGRKSGSNRISGDKAKVRLTTRLWDYLNVNLAMPGGTCARDRPANGQVETFTAALGKPILMTEGVPGPSVSFTHLDGKTWAAMSSGEACVGIDAARGSEFGVGYPLHRAFHREELEDSLEWADGSTQEAAALLWSVKEAVVKAMGCGFHVLDPLDLSVGPWEQREPSIMLRVTPLARAIEKYPLIGKRPIAASAFRERGERVAVAAVDPIQTWRPSCARNHPDHGTQYGKASSFGALRLEGEARR